MGRVDFVNRVSFASALALVWAAPVAAGALIAPQQQQSAAITQHMLHAG